jgi:midasin
MVAIFMQEIAEQFICLLKAEYLDYQDLAQPIQLCVFDLKLGLSLLLSAFLQGKFLKCGSRDSNDVYLHVSTTC